MYDLVDRPVSDLPPFEARTLAAIRRWVHAMMLAGAGEGSTADCAFGRAMRLIDRGSSDDLAIGRPCQPLVGESEAVLVALWRLVGDADRAARGLAAMIVGDEAEALVVAIEASQG